MTRGIFRLSAKRGKVEAGVTFSDEPTTRNRSHLVLSSRARVNSASGRRCPKRIVADLRKPPHTGQQGSISPALMRCCSSVIEERVPQRVHAAKREVP